MDIAMRPGWSWTWCTLVYTQLWAEAEKWENFQLDESEEFEADESEDTMSILSRYIEESETELNKTVIQSLIKEIYQEACEVV